jgi:hypothetical protein
LLTSQDNRAPGHWIYASSVEIRMATLVLGDALIGRLV